MINLELEVKEVEVVLQALANMPYGQVAQLFNNIQQQATAQIQQQKPEGQLADKVIG